MTSFGEKERKSEWQALPATWVWRKRGIVSLESVCEITSSVARGKYVLAPPAPSPGTLVAMAGQRIGKQINIFEMTIKY